MRVMDLTTQSFIDGGNLKEHEFLKIIKHLTEKGFKNHWKNGSGEIQHNSFSDLKEYPLIVFGVPRSEITLFSRSSNIIEHRGLIETDKKQILGNAHLMTDKQQALEELAAVMDKWCIDFIAYDDGTVEMDVDHESVISTFGIIDAETIQTELNRMKECQK